MKLNTKDYEIKLNEIRNFIEKSVVDIEDGKKLKLDLSLLNELMFATYKDGIKFIVWSGPFLRKIDLSEVNFDNVYWEYDRSNRTTDLSYTNARIDFSKAYGTSIINCNFSHMDLTESNINVIQEISNSDFSYTKGIDSLFKLLNHKCKICDSNFEGTNLSKCTVDVRSLSPVAFDYDLLLCLKNVNLCNTALTFRSDINYGLECLGLEIKSGRLGGCYYGEKYIHTKRELEQIRDNMLKEYFEYCGNYIKTIKEDIEQKIRILKKDA